MILNVAVRCEVSFIEKKKEKNQAITSFHGIAAGKKNTRKNQ